MKKLLILGSTGFIGQNLVRYFSGQGKYEIYAGYHLRPPCGRGDVRNVHVDCLKEEDVRRAVAGMDIVIQAAATTSGSRDIVERPYYHVTDNAVMNSLLLRAVYESDVRHFVYTSCTVMYPSSEIPLQEDQVDEDRIFDRYYGVAWTKLYIEKMCRFFSSIAPDKKFTAIRHSNIYGPHDKFDIKKGHVLGATIRKVMDARDGGTLSVWGTGEEKRDFLYVDDLTAFIDAALERQREGFGLYNVGSGEAVDVNTLIQAIVECSGKTLSITHDLSQPSLKTDIRIDCSRAREELGWSARTGLREGLQKTMDWYVRNEAACEPGR